MQVVLLRSQILHRNQVMCLINILLFTIWWTISQVVLNRITDWTGRLIDSNLADSIGQIGSIRWFCLKQLLKQHKIWIDLIQSCHDCCLFQFKHNFQNFPNSEIQIYQSDVPIGQIATFRNNFWCPRCVSMILLHGKMGATNLHLRNKGKNRLKIDIAEILSLA